MSEHTGGTWKAHGTTIDGPDGMIGEVGFGLRDDAEMMANAALMAAASELLAAVEAYVAAARGYAAVPVPEATARALVEAMVLGVSARDRARGQCDE